jgi:hypothetical protein
MKQFVPITDDMLFDAENFVGPLVPYRFGVSCARQLRDNERGAADQFPTVNVSPALTPSLSAMPALSSST